MKRLVLFLVGGLLTAILGFSGIFQKALSYIPQSLTSAMLAGVLLKFGISLFASLQNDWAFVLSLLSIYVITKDYGRVIALYLP